MSRESDQREIIRDQDSETSSSAVVERQARDGAVSLERINAEIEALTEHLKKEGVDFSPNVVRISKAEAGKMVETINRIISGDNSIMDSPDELTRAKSMLSGMTVFLGEIYAEYEQLVNLRWQQIKNVPVERLTQKGERRMVHRTDGEVTRIVESSDDYKKMRHLKYKIEGVEKVITSIRDRLGTLNSSGQKDPGDSYNGRRWG